MTVRWIPPEPVPFAHLAAATGLHPRAAELLYRRGYRDPGAVRRFLEPPLGCDPVEVPDLEEAAARILRAVRRGESIAVYGDYDADGVTATVLLVETLRRLGSRPRYVLPDRFHEGYGLSAGRVEELAARGIRFLVTCDCGVTAHAEVALAARLGMEVVVTDHHELPPELPPAAAVVSPLRLPPGHPCRHLPGVGTAWLVARELFRQAGRDPAEADRYLDLVAIGVVADVVPVLGANRAVLVHGLRQLTRTGLPGLAALLRLAVPQGDVDEEAVAFQLVPRLNAAGRLASARLAVELLLAEEPDRAGQLALELDLLNRQRRELTAAVLAEAEAILAGGEPGPAAVLYRPHWPEGVLGIAAGQIARRHGIAAVLLARKEDGVTVTGSARAPEGVPLFDAVLRCAPLLHRFGGHAAAAGLSLPEHRVEEFRERFHQAIAELRVPSATPPVRVADLAVDLDEVNPSLFEGLRELAPFGQGHPAPVLLARNARILSARATAGGRHRRLVLGGREARLGAVWWRAPEEPLPEGPVDVAFRLTLDRYSGQTELQLVVEGLHPSASPAYGPLIAWEAAAAADEEVPPATPAPAPPRLVDRRGQPLSRIREEFPDGAVARPGDPVPRAATLILPVPPPSPDFLLEIVALSSPVRIILAWPQVVEAEPLPAWLLRLAEALRHLRLHEAMPDADALAARLWETPGAVQAGLDALQKAGTAGADLATGRGEAVRLLARRLRETRAFRTFLARAPLGQIEALLSPVSPSRR